jgi:hypothetical protein
MARGPRDYLRVKLNDPSLSQPLTAALSWSPDTNDALRASIADNRPHYASRRVPGALGRSGCAGIRCHLRKQPLRRESLRKAGKDSGEHRKSDLRTLRRHDRVRLDAAAHRYRHRDRRSNGADSMLRSLASETPWCAAADRKDDHGRRLPRSLARAAFLCSGSRRSRQAHFR